MSQTPLTDAYLASRCKGENKQSWVEFAMELESKLREAQVAMECRTYVCHELAQWCKRCATKIGIDQSHI